MDYYRDKKVNYYNRVRDDLIDLMPDNPEQYVLEIGAGGGDTLLAIKDRNLAKVVVGVDLFTLPNSNQYHPSIDKFIYINIEKHDLPFESNFFDTIICGDVLEHLIDPWNAVIKLVRYIKPGGLIIISVPNIRHYKVLFKIAVKGTFEYNPEGGILDKTHMRFFCKKNIKQLLSIDELEIQRVLPINYHANYKLGKKVRLFNILTAKIFEEFFIDQYLAVAKRSF